MSKSPVDFDDHGPGPSKPTKKASRRSILNITRRQSKSCVGIPFEDQVAAIDSELDVGERLSRLLRVTASAALKAVVFEMQQDSDAGSNLGEVIDEVCSDLRTKDFTRVQCAQEVAEKIGQMTAGGGGGAASSSENLLPSRVREIRKYIKDMEKESAVWKELLYERRDTYKASRAEKKAVTKKEVKITEDTFKGEVLLSQKNTAENLTRRVLYSKKRLRAAKNELCASFQKKRKRVSDVEAYLAVAANKIMKISDAQNAKDIQNQRGEEESSRPTAFAQEVSVLRREILDAK